MVEPVLSILICTLKGRESSLKELIASISIQTGIFNYLVHESAFQINSGWNDKVEVITLSDNAKMTTGAKRNKLLEMAAGKYIVFCDDDDEIFDCYVEEILKAAESDCDCMGITGIMTTNGVNEIGWELSKDFENETIIRNGKPFYARKTNHIAPVKRELALLTMFPEISNGEDKGYSDKLNPLLKTEYKIEPLMYHYKYITRPKEYLK